MLSVQIRDEVSGLLGISPFMATSSHSRRADEQATR